MINKDITIVNKAISFFKDGDYSAAKDCYLEASELFGEHLFINNIKICDLRLQRAEAFKKNKAIINIFIDNIALEKETIKEIGHFSISNEKDTLELEADCIESFNTKSNYKLILLFEFFDENNQLIESLPSIGVSAAFNKHFKYFANVSIKEKNLFKKTIKTQFNPEVKNCKVYLASVGLPNEEVINVSLYGEFRPFSIQENIKSTLLSDKNNTENIRKNERKIVNLNQSIKPIVRTTVEKKTTKDLNIACVLDEFTMECLKEEVTLVKLTQEKWQEELEASQIDFLLVESCWRGNNGNWGTLTKGSGGGRKLGALLQYCKKKNIPTVFWNKEDPPHYEKFSPVAKMFDQVITTDINMLPHYKDDHNIDAYPLSFAAQPKIHRPNSSIQRLNKAVFAGSYYGDKPKRCQDFNQLMQQLKLANIDYDIYDRNYHREIDKFKFPEQYQPHIVGNLPASEVWKAHQGYKYQINMNTVQDSKTMFARRVYESLASGTPVISNDSLGVRELFGDLVLFSDKKNRLVDKLIELEKHPEKYDKLARKGVRRVMREHTYAHRIQEICSLLGIPVEVEHPRAAMSVQVNNEYDIKNALSLFSEQTAVNKHLYLELDNFDKAYQYLNKSTEQISYVMSFAKDLYESSESFYGTNTVLKVEANSVLEKEALEDYTYWGEL